MPDTLAQVKRGLGSGAIILHTRSYRQGGILGIGAQTIVEITAADGRDPKVQQARLRTHLGGSHQSGMKGDSPAMLPKSVKGLDHQASAGDLIRRTYAAAKAELIASNKNPDQDKRGSDSDPCNVAVVPINPWSTTQNTVIPSESHPTPVPIMHTNQQLADEMLAMRHLVGRLLRRQTTQAGSGEMPDKLFHQYLNLLKQDVTEELAEQIVQEVRCSLDHDTIQDDASVRLAVLNKITRLIPTDSTAGKLKSTDDGRPRTIALIGPTGVGKTTTLAKLAANFKLSQKKSVGLITMDTFRIGAVEQLRIYADIIKVPLHVVSSPDELLWATERCADCAAILIDTAGRSQRDDPKLEQLSQFISASRPHEVHLVLSSTSTQSVLLDTIHRFSRIQTDRIIFTKLDEAVTFGVVLNVIRKARKQLSFVTTGQEVPRHIEAGRPDRLAALVMGEQGI